MPTSLQFIGDPRFTPRWIVGAHGTDELLKIDGEFGTSSWPGLPAPEQTKTFPMPPDEGLRLDQNQGTPPFEKLSQEDHEPSGSVGRPMRLNLTFLKQGQLLPEK